MLQVTFFLRRRASPYVHLTLPPTLEWLSQISHGDRLTNCAKRGQHCSEINNPQNDANLIKLSENEVAELPSRNPIMLPYQTSLYFSTCSVVNVNRFIYNPFRPLKETYGTIQWLKSNDCNKRKSRAKWSNSEDWFYDVNSSYSSFLLIFFTRFKFYFCSVILVPS